MYLGMGPQLSLVSYRKRNDGQRTKNLGKAKSTGAVRHVERAAHPVGTLVYFKRELGKACTQTPAFMTAFGAVALLFLEVRERPVHLDAITTVKGEGCTH